MHLPKLQTVLDTIIWAVIGPLIMPLFLTFYLLKSFVGLVIYFLRPDLSFTNTDDLAVARGSLDKKPIVDIGFILRVQGDVQLKKLKEEFSSHFLKDEEVTTAHPFYRLHCTFESFLGYLCIKKVDLDIDKQIKEDPIPLIGSPQEYFSTWLHSPYKNDGGPRWEMLLVKSPKENVSFVAFRMHHGLIDGFGMLLIVDKLCGQQSPYLIPPSPELNLSDKFSLLLQLPRVLVSYWVKASFFSTWPLASISNADKVDKFHLSWTTLDIELLKTVRRKLGVPFSSILYTLQTGALRRHLIATGKGHEITDTLPVLHTIPKPNHPRTVFTNHWTFVKLHTPFSDPDPVSRVRSTEAEYEAFVESRLNISGPLFFGYFINLMPTRFCPMNVANSLSLYKASLSSMVRASEQYKLFGANVTNIYHTFCTKDLCPHTVLYTTTASHNKQIDITLAASPLLVQNQEAMNLMADKYLKEELDELVEKCRVN